MSPVPPHPFGVEIAGVGSAIPDRRLTNKDLESMMDTSDEWIVQRTGIAERRVHDAEKGENTALFSRLALEQALHDAKLTPDDIDLMLVATMTPDMPTPSVSCVVAHELGCRQIPALDLNAACSGFVYSINVAHALAQTGMYKTIALVGADCLTRHCDYSTYGRNAAILFGDAAGAVILRTTEDTSKGIIAQAMHSDGSGGNQLSVPVCKFDLDNPDEFEDRMSNKVYMNGKAVFKFAVSKFPEVIQETLDLAGLEADDVDHYICHQSNARILSAARDRFGLAEEKMHVNIHQRGNTVAASCPLVLHELQQAGRIKPGQKVMFLAFGAGLTWASSLWQI